MEWDEQNSLNSAGHLKDKIVKDWSQISNFKCYYFPFSIDLLPIYRPSYFYDKLWQMCLNFGELYITLPMDGVSNIIELHIFVWRGGGSTDWDYFACFYICNDMIFVISLAEFNLMQDQIAYIICNNS